MDFFIGLQLGGDIISVERIVEDASGNKTSKKSTSGGASFGLKTGILSEEEYVGGRFYAEFSYLKIPQFNTMTVGLDLDLLVKYYESANWRIGGFLGIGGGMNVALIADTALDNAGKKSLIAVGWVNIGLVRFIYGSHSVELNARYQYVAPTIYSLKNKTSGETVSYKSSTSTIMLSYVFSF